MKTITKLIVQKSDKNRVSLYLDDKFFCGLDIETVVKNGLKVGSSIAEEKLENIQIESEKQIAYQKALKLISVRYKTQKEVERYLFDKGYLAPVVYYVISKLNEYHYIDDERYVQSYIETHKNMYGKLKIKQQLMLKGIKESLIDDAFNQDFDQDEQILRLAEKYMKSKEPTKENYIKLFKHLLSKGFEYEEIKSVLKKDFD